MDGELRGHPRVGGGLGAEMRCFEGRFGGRAFNLSLTGCYLETRGALRSPRVEVVFPLPGRGRELACDAEVMRTDAKRDGSLGVALRFVRADWETLLGLARLVAPHLG